MKELILQKSTWRCGHTDPYKSKYGVGITQLLNKQGKMCCLGQFAYQLGVSKDELFNRPNPRRLNTRIDLLNAPSLLNDSLVNTEFSRYAIQINDNWRTTPAQKISALKKLCKQHGYNLKVID